jgi:hypothetical protein
VWRLQFVLAVLQLSHDSPPERFQLDVATWSGMLLGWFAIPIFYLVAVRVLAKYFEFYHVWYNKWIACYLTIGSIISTTVIWIDVVDPYGDSSAKIPVVQFFEFMFVTLNWPIYIPGIPYIFSCAVEMVLHDFTCG